jgi:hypothetical protein
MRQPLLATSCLLAGLLASPAWADRPAVSFSRHIVPVLSRLGCNAGACHGALRGKNGFRLSLFGSDPAADHDRLLRDFGGRRLDFLAPRRSLLLLKGTCVVPHEGGPRLRVGSSEYKLILDWIARDAPLDEVARSRVARLTVAPRETVARPGGSHRLLVEVKYSDGSVADVTTLCHFESSDPTVATVDREGRVSIRGPGEVGVLVRYGWKPVVAGFLVPRASKADFPDIRGHNFIDRHVLDKLRRLNLPPADLCDDAVFLRRVRLDATGALPEPDEVRNFLADPRPDKRARKIEEVLAAGGGIKPGQVVGSTDKDAAYVKDREYKIASLGKTIYHLLGLDPDHELKGSDGRPLKLITEDVPLIKEVL